jgi:2,4-dienoyl-CoA reductase-like NADH-dependent reductase (Old Yellow Enzyme family)
MRKLFEETKIKGMTLKNRFIKAAVWEALATEDGHMTPALYDIYEDLAKGGIGTILTGYTYVHRDEQPNPNMMAIYDDSFIEDYKVLTQKVHQHGANIVLQLVYGGSQSYLNPPSQNIWGPSPVVNGLTGITPKEMTLEDIRDLIDLFVQAALRAKAAGFDGVQLHAAHGYLLSQFLCPHYNRRRDTYGGALVKRARILVELVKAVRQAVGEDYPILMKINSQDYMEDGLTSEESIEVTKMLEAAGLDAIEISGGNESTPHVLENNLGPARGKVNQSKDNESYFKGHGKTLAAAISIPVILTGGNRHIDVMEGLLETTEIAYFALGRPMIAEPDLIVTWSKDMTKSPKCLSCNGCYHTPGKRCVLNLKE